MVGQGVEMETEAHPMICYSPTMGQYVELCAHHELIAIQQAFGTDCDDAGAIRIPSDDIRHTHNGDGSCISVVTPMWSRSSSFVRAIMGRAFTAGYDMYRP